MNSKRKEFKSEVVTFRLTPTQKDKVNETCQKNNVKRSTVLQKIVEGYYNLK